MPALLDTRKPDFEQQFRTLLEAKRETADDVNATVAAIIADVRKRGDAALIEYTQRFDGLALTPSTLRIGADEIARAAQQVPAAERAALERAADRIRVFHERQLPKGDRFIDEKIGRAHV